MRKEVERVYTEEEFLYALERMSKRAGVRPILAALLNWISRGVYLDVLETILDNFAEKLQTGTADDGAPKA